MLQRVERNVYIDILKSFLIVTVVVGHTYCAFYPGQYIYTWGFKLIYSFHMFLFMFVSGYLVKYVGCDMQPFWLRKRFKRLMVPYLVWTMLYMVIRNDFSIVNYLTRIIEPSFWFLIVLFLYDATYFSVNLITKDVRKQMEISFLIAVGAVLLWYVTRGIIKNSEILHMYSIYLPYYLSGIFVGMYKLQFSGILKKSWLFVVVGYPLSMSVYSYKDHAVFIDTVNFISMNVTGYEFPTGVLFYLSVLYNHYVVALLGSLFWLIVMYWLYTRGVLGKKFSYIGRFTLAIYVIGASFNVHYTGVFLLDFLLSVALGVVIPIIIENILKRIPVLHYITFGSYK